MKAETWRLRLLPVLGGAPGAIAWGGGSNAGQQQSWQSQSSSTTSDPSPVVQGPLKQIVGYFGDFLNKNPNAPALPDFSTVAPQSEATRQALSALSSLGSGLAGSVQPANDKLASDTLAGAYLDPASNPYLQNYLGQGFQQQNEAFNDTVLPALRSSFEGAGRSGSPADFNVAMRAAYDLDRSQAQAAAGAESQAYGDERNRQLQTQSLLPSFQGMDLQRALAALQGGQVADQFAQQQRDEQVLRDLYGKTGNLDYWSTIASRLLGAYPGGTTQGTGSSTGYAQSSQQQQNNPLAAILGGAGLGLQAIGAFSDRRAKTDIEKLGVDPLTGLPMYAWRYKRDPKTYPKVVGPMAQDAEKAGMPVRHIGGHKVIALQGGITS